jgi:hypothetical protein
MFCYFLPRLKLCINFDKKVGCTTFWAIFSQTHLVTLLGNGHRIGSRNSPETAARAKMTENNLKD